MQGTMRSGRAAGGLGGAGLVGAALGLILSAGMAAAGGVAFVATPVPPISGGLDTVAAGVNNAGWVVGQGDNEFGELVGFVYADGVTTALPVLPGGFDAKAASVNSSGLIVGECRDANEVLRPVKWERNGQGEWEITDLGTLDRDNLGFGVATRVNDAGEIVGYTQPAPTSGYHATRWDVNGAKHDLGTLHYAGVRAYSQALGISDSGIVTGFAYGVLMGPEHGFYWTADGDQVDVTPAAAFGLAQWFNATDTGVLGGYVSGPMTGGQMRAAIWRDRVGYEIPAQIDGTEGGYGYDINNDEVLVGTQFLLAPAPEPNLFLAFMYKNGVTIDLNTVTKSAPGLLAEAPDISHNGNIAVTALVDGFPQAVLLTPEAGGECPADLTGDGVVDDTDFVLFAQAYDQFTVPPADARADFDASGFVDDADFVIFAQAYDGFVCP